jgi:iron(III) transport system substrate-binding protein
MKARWLVAVAAALLLAGACADSPTEESDDGGSASQEDTKTGYEDVLSEIEGLTGKARTDKLVELAGKEGGILNVYTSMTSDVEDEVAGVFGDTYDIDVSVYRADSETVLQRLLQESQADFPGADIAETNGTELFILNNEGVLAPYESDLQDDLVEGSVYEGWTADRFNKFVISWNTQSVSETERPKSWEDLADPKWDGQLAMEPSDVDWYKTLYEYWVNEAGKSEEEVNKLFEDMASDALFVKGHTLTGDLLGAGDFQVAASNYSYLVEGVIDDGAPVAWEPPVEPIITRPNGVGLVKNGQHPATAILFVDWILTDGQKVLQEFALDPARSDLATTPNTQEVLVDLEGFTAEQEEWTSRYEQLVELGKVVEE